MVKVNNKGLIWLTEYNLRDQNVTLITYETKMKTTNNLMDQMII